MYTERNDSVHVDYSISRFAQKVYPSMGGMKRIRMYRVRSYDGNLYFFGSLEEAVIKCEELGFGARLYALKPYTLSTYIPLQ